jgi:transcriptional regulator with XRE-family HTH domain
LRIKGVCIASDDLLPVQCRMARAALQWSLDDVAAIAGVNRKTILAFEQGGRRPRDANAEAIRGAFEAAGVRFLHAGPDAGGVVPPLAQE